MLLGRAPSQPHGAAPPPLATRGAAPTGLGGGMGSPLAWGATPAQTIDREGRGPGLSPARKQRHRDWYKVSVDTLRGWGMFALVVLLGIGAWFGFRVWEQHAIQREAARTIDTARVLFQRVRAEPTLATFQTEYEAAWDGIERARALYGEGRFEAALARATGSREMLLSLLDASRHGHGGGEAQFLAVQGGVEFRRSDRGAWEPARGRVMLEPGDYVKTGNNGSAEIMFVDGTLYTVRPDTLFLVSARRRGDADAKAVELQYGWINLNTAQSSSRVATPRAEAVVGQQSEAMVAYDGASGQGRFAAYRGEIRVAADGEERRIGPLQTLTQSARLAEVKPLPPAPTLLAPAENADVDIDRERRLRIAWAEVDGSERYALQISRNRLFVDNVIDVANRRRAEATLGVQGEGTFLWRVAAINEENERGPWSEPGRFRVASFRTGGGPEDREPPELEVQDVQSYGSIFIVSGRTEPGASVWINEESVTVEADGAFTKTIQLIQSGWAFLEVKAADVAGNEATRRNRVFVESL